MTTFEFKPYTTMKEYNQDNYWIMNDIIRPLDITADDLNAALLKFAEHAEESGIYISKNALRKKSAMFQDTTEADHRQIGYVITGATDIQKDDYSWSKQFVDIWTEIRIVNSCF